MYLKNSVMILLMLVSINCFAQIKVPDVGDGWKAQVDSAIQLIKKTDTISYNILIDNCKQIEYIIGDRSTCKLPNTIAINVKDIELNSINNLAAILVHEAHHLHYSNQSMRLDSNFEEYLCYRVEYDFLCKLPDTEDWLFKNCINSLLYYRNLICRIPGNK